MGLIPALPSSLVHWLWCSVRQNATVARVCDKQRVFTFYIKEVGGGERGVRAVTQTQVSRLCFRHHYQLNHLTGLCLENVGVFSSMGLDCMVSLQECCILFILMVSHLNDWHSGRHFALKSLPIVAGTDSSPHFLYQQDQRFLSQQ